MGENGAFQKKIDRSKRYKFKHQIHCHFKDSHNRWMIEINNNLKHRSSFETVRYFHYYIFSLNYCFVTLVFLLIATGQFNRYGHGWMLLLCWRTDCLGVQAGENLLCARGVHQHTGTDWQQNLQEDERLQGGTLDGKISKYRDKLKMINYKFSSMCIFLSSACRCIYTVILK